MSHCYIIIKSLLDILNMLSLIIIKIKDIIPVIMSIEDVDEAIINSSSLPCDSIGSDMINILFEEFH